MISPKTLLSNVSHKIHFIIDTGESPRYLAALQFFLAAALIVFVLNMINAYYLGHKVKDRILTNSFHALENLFTNSFAQAKQNFISAEKELWFINQNSFISQKNQDLVKTADYIIKSGKLFSESGKIALEAVVNSERIFANMFLSLHSNRSLNSSLTENLATQFEKISQSFQLLKEAQKTLNHIDTTNLPKNLRSEFIAGKIKLEKIVQLSHKIQYFFPSFLDLLGDRHPRKYLVLFANNNEQRAIMGFLGSGMILELNDGYITKNQVFDIYEIDGQIVEKIPLPKVFESITGNWGLRDSNYSPDARISSFEAMRLFEKAGREGIDGVIYIDLEVLRSLLRITGPLTLSGISMPIESHNFDQVLSYIIESKVEGLQDPKNAIKRLVPEMISRLSDNQVFSQFLKQMPQLIAEKHLIAYSKIEPIQELFESLNLSAKITPPSEKQDYLSVINTSISGNKSDAYIKENLNLKTSIKQNGIIVNTLTLKRKHTFTKDSKSNLQDLGSIYKLPPLTPELIKILGKGRNKVSVRIYVPRGSRLKDISGKRKDEIEVKYDHDLKLSYFQTLIEVEPDQQTEITLTYELPFILSLNKGIGLDSYELIVQKQPGAKTIPFSQEIIFENPNMKIYKTLPSNAIKSEKGLLRFNTNLEQDQKIAVLMGK